MVPAVKSGRADIIQSSIFSTPVRAKQVDFVDYMKSYTGSLLHKGNPDHITSLTDLCGRSDAEVIGAVEPAIVQAQSAGCVREGKPPIALQLYKDNDLAIEQIRNGRAACFLVDAGLASILARRFPNDLQSGFSINSGLGVGTAVNKHETELRSAIFAALGTLQHDGIIARLLAKWGINPRQEIPITVVR